MMRVLVIEDERRVREFIARGLRAERWTVSEAASGLDGLELARGGGFDVIILDLMLPGVPGLDVCRILRTEGLSTPILMLTALDDVADKVEGLRAGADDYLAKPFHFEELIARLQALTRRRVPSTPGESELIVGDLVLDLETMEVRRGSREIRLTAKELAILELLMRAPGKVMSRQRILAAVWGSNEDPLTNIVDVYMARLRKRIDADEPQALLETVRGHGYRLARLEPIAHG